MKLVAIVTAGLLVALAALFASTAQGQEQVDVAIDELNGSGVTGSATVESTGNGETEITISLMGLEADSSHVNHLHEGTGCGSGEYSGIVQELTSLDADASGEGSATTTVSIDYDTVASGEHVLVIHAGASLQDDPTPIACGHIPVASLIAPPPAGTGFSPDGTTTGFAIALSALAAGGFALLGGGWLLRRRTATQVR